MNVETIVDGRSVKTERLLGLPMYKLLPWRRQWLEKLFQALADDLPQGWTFDSVTIGQIQQMPTSVLVAKLKNDQLSLLSRVFHCLNLQFTNAAGGPANPQVYFHADDDWKKHGWVAEWYARTKERHQLLTGEESADPEGSTELDAELGPAEPTKPAKGFRLPATAFKHQRGKDLWRRQQVSVVFSRAISDILTAANLFTLNDLFNLVERKGLPGLLEQAPTLSEPLQRGISIALKEKGIAWPPPAMPPPAEPISQKIEPDCRQVSTNPSLQPLPAGAKLLNYLPDRLIGQLARANLKTVGQIRRLSETNLQTVCPEVSTSDITLIFQRINKLRPASRRGGVAATTHNGGTEKIPQRVISGDQTTGQSLNAKGGQLIAPPNNHPQPTTPGTRREGATALKPIEEKAISCLNCGVVINHALNNGGFEKVKDLLAATREEVQKKSGLKDIQMDTLARRLADQNLKLASGKGAEPANKKKPATEAEASETKLSKFMSFNVAARLRNDFGINSMEQLRDRRDELNTAHGLTRNAVDEALRQFAKSTGGATAKKKTAAQPSRAPESANLPAKSSATTALMAPSPSTPARAHLNGSAFTTADLLQSMGPMVEHLLGGGLAEVSVHGRMRNGGQFKLELTPPDVASTESV